MNQTSRMRLINALFILLLALLGCGSPDQHAPNTYGTVHVWISASWLPIDRPRIIEQLANLSRLGPTFVVDDAPYYADVLIYPFNSDDCKRTGAGRWWVSTRSIEVDPVCTQGDTAFRTAIGHEIGHVLGMRHICTYPQETADCSPVGFGRAMMNPTLTEGDDPLSPVPFTDRPTELDLLEFRRVFRVRHPVDAGSVSDATAPTG
jgi:hypothetical protein